MDFKTSKKILNGIQYGQKRNKYSNRQVKNIELTPYDIINLYEKQNAKCYWSGLSLECKYNYIKFHPFAISVDRLDNSIGYLISNVVLCRRIFNLGKIAFNSIDFKEVMDTLHAEYKKL